MKKSFRLALLVCSGLVALAVTGSAMAAYTTPRIIVKNPNEKPGAGGVLTVRVEQTKEDDATFRLVIYIPKGYTMTLIPQEGQTIGTVVAQAQANAISPDAVLELTGTIKGDTYTAAKYPLGQACAGATSPINAVFRLELSAAGQQLNVPMYVTALTAGPLSTLYAAQLVTCLPSPYVPPSAGGATFGAKLINAELSFTVGFTNPATAGDYRWSTLWTPYTVGTATPNTTGTVEAQSVDRLDAQLTLTAKTKGRNVTLSGSLLEGGKGVPAAKVQLQLGKTAARLKAAGSATTKASGAFSASFPNRKAGTWFARARVTVADRATPCVQSFAPVPCIAANIPGFANLASRVVRFRIR